MPATATVLALALPAAAASGLLAYGTFAPASRLWGPVISHGRSGSGPAAAGVALTFDDGPTPGPTEAVLDALAEADVRAAFFVVGVNAQRWPTLLERVDGAGHVVGNHTWDHSHYGLFRRNGYWRAQVERTDRIIERAIGRRPALFRPPMGIKTGHITGEARRAGHSIVTWNRRAFDTREADAGAIVDRLASRARSGDVLLLHDGIEPHARRRASGARATAAAVVPLVRALRDKGLEPVRLDVLLGLKPYQETAGPGGAAAVASTVPARRTGP